MAGKLLELAIAIKGKIEKSLPESMRQAMANASRLQEQLNGMNKAIADTPALKLDKLQGIQSQIQQFAQYKKAVQEVSAQIEQNKTRTAQLAAEYRKAQAATAAAQRSVAPLKAAFEQARNSTAFLKTELANLKRTAKEQKSSLPIAEYQRLQAQIAQATAQYKSSQAATRAANEAYKNASANVKQLSAAEKSLGQSFEQAKSKGAQLKRELEAKQLALQRVRDSLKAAGVSTGHLAQEEARLQQEIRQTKRAVEEAAAAQEKLNAIRQRKAAAKATNDNAQQNFHYASSNLQSGISTVQSVAAPLIDATNVAMEFEATMSKVRAITGASSADMQKLTATAQELGEKTMFSAKQSAEAMTYLGMAGWKTEQIIGAMPGLLDLAAAGGTDLATTADIVSDAMTAFGLSADKAGDFADVLAAASSNANTNVQMMGETFKYAAPLAGSLGFNIKDTATAIGLMANAGIKASQAGTSLRSILSRIALEGSDAQSALERYGVTVTDGAGKMKPLANIMKDMRGAFSQMSEVEKINTAKVVAGQEAMSALLSIVNASDSDFNQLTAAIENSNGAAAKMATVMQNNAKGSITTFKSAVEGAQIAVGNLLLPVLGQMAAAATEAVRIFTSWAKANPELLYTLIAIGAAIAGVVIAALTVQAAIATWALLKSTITLLSVSLEEAAVKHKSLTVLTWAQTKATAALNAVFSKQAAKNFINSIVTQFNSLRALSWAQVGTSIKTSLASAALSAKASLTALIAKMQATGAASLAMAHSFNISSVIASFTGGIKAAGTALLGFGKAAMGFIFSPIGIAIAAIAAAAYLIYRNWDKLAPFFTGLWNEIVNTLSAAWAALQPMFDALRVVFEQLWNVITTQLADAWKSLQAAMGENSSAIGVIVDVLTVLATVLGGTVLAALLVLAKCFTAVLTTAINVAVSVVNMFLGTLQGVIMFITGIFSGDWQKAWSGVVKIFGSIFGGIKDVAYNVLGGVKDFVMGIIDGIKTALNLGSNLKAPEVNTADGMRAIRENAEGGIYRKGAFLTTFAEKSAEAAIPLDGSSRAVALWQQAGQMLGALPKGMPQLTANVNVPQKLPQLQTAVDVPKELPQLQTAVDMPQLPQLTTSVNVPDKLPQLTASIPDVPQLETILKTPEMPQLMAAVQMPDIPVLNIAAEMAQMPSVEPSAAPVIQGTQQTTSPISFEYHAPAITINGNADNDTVAQIKAMLEAEENKFTERFRREFGRMQADNRRFSYA